MPQRMIESNGLIKNLGGKGQILKALFVGNDL